MYKLALTRCYCHKTFYWHNLQMGQVSLSVCPFQVSWILLSKERISPRGAPFPSRVCSWPYLQIQTCGSFVHCDCKKFYNIDTLLNKRLICQRLVYTILTISRHWLPKADKLSLGACNKKYSFLLDSFYLDLFSNEMYFY
jgi:hypothetical protein